MRAEMYNWHGEAMQAAHEAMEGGPDYSALARARADTQDESDRQAMLRSMNHGHIFHDWNCVCGMSKKEYMLTPPRERRVCLGKPYELLPENK